MNNIKQKKAADLIQSALAHYFLMHSAIDYLNALINITEVNVTNDFSIAKIYVSIMPSNKYNREEVFKLIESNNKNIRKEVGNALAKKLRKIPELRFYFDKSLDIVEKIDTILKNNKQ